MDDDHTQFAARLQQLIASGSVRSFAIGCGIGESLMRSYLSGSEPGLDKILKIWMHAKCSLSWLVAGEGDAYPDSNLGAREDRAHYVVDDPNVVRVPHFDVRASAGLGAENSAELVTRKNYFRRDWWEREISRPEGDCFSTDIVGDSMFPILTERHMPIFLRTDEVHADAIYVFRFSGEVFVKYLERRPEGLIARSANTFYTQWEIGDGTQFSEFKVIGRLIYKQLGERV